ncbi:hypothetical protein [Streptomyces sp. NPDC088350]|uniref:hypothetical protein n=1 Tax=Streptomyces sp. NPDC088350 TaxID=3365854 RepID=UPI0037F17725
MTIASELDLRTACTRPRLSVIERKERVLVFSILPDRCSGAEREGRRSGRSLLEEGPQAAHRASVSWSAASCGDVVDRVCVRPGDGEIVQVDVGGRW